MSETGMRNGRAWIILAISTAAQSASSVIIASGAFLIPALNDPNGGYQLTLAAAGTVAAMTTAGLMLTLVLWGLLVDRAGERVTLMIGLSAGAAAMSAPLLHQVVRGEGIEASGPVALAGILLAGGMAAGSANAASGRLVIGWFPVHRRGTAMGIRQMAQPLGVATAAVSIPTVAALHGVAVALAIPALLSLLAAAATALWVTDPQRPSRTSPNFSELRKHPYARHTGLLRIHASAVLLVIPQFTIWSFALVWLMTEREWSAFTAGLLVGAIQLAGAGGRVAAGAWSDRIGSRTTPIRIIAVTAAVTMGALAFTDLRGMSIAIVLLVAAGVITVADNGVAFTAAAEIAGPFWGGRVLSIHNTAQNAVAAAVPPAFGATITAVGFPATFALAAVFALLAAPVVPSAIGART
ncbi:MFS transporter [Hoyosella subflava]|uniref:Sugar major facilitator transporter n=1 Tax=Hoyosella subflava (strain DSM 45089 / JCM 17490 / NBRC 109087 / DQS3-9A1) TaxID=443218 RepID=F6ENG6_HOYSD|nr:MFS transporter [Hoyosella subflava]AEF41635.1 Sugar major facilitator transporter [Hoyosella subflava DQS3-9A1]